ncbi:MAG: VOC family protein, partial [Bryobacteraceae bacterium]
MRLHAWLLVACQLSLAAELPIAGLASAGFRVSDLEAARRFYTGLLGLEEAFELASPGGRLERVFLKVNDEQFIELLPGLAPGQNERLAHIAIQCRDVRRLHRYLEEHGLKPAPVETRADGNPGFWLKDPGGTRLEFVEYAPGG